MRPLAEILRPQKIEDVIGQNHLLGNQGPIIEMIKKGHLDSMIFWGPPGCGKTTLARIVADTFELPFTEFSGVEFSVKKLIELKNANPKLGEDDKPKLIFVDEIHRLNKSQQANFLPYVESGEWILIGATTENPSFEVITPLLSRSKLFVLKNLEIEDLIKLIDRVEQYWKENNIKRLKLNKEVKRYLAEVSNGDARLLLNTLQSLQNIFADTKPSISEIKKAVGNMHLVYDKHGEQHYDTISALHKSMRGSDPNASVYYLARMLEGGEDPVYIARRCLRFAAEDIGNADRGALIIANSAFEAVTKIGMPECDVILAQLVIYLAKAKKSNEAYVAYNKAKEDVRKYGNLEIPLKIRNAPTKTMKELGYGKDYKYAHDYSAEELKDEQYLPDKLKNRKYIT